MKRGDVFPHPGDGSPVRVMAVEDGYAMCRRSGRMPFVARVRDIEALLDRASSGVGKAGGVHGSTL